MSAISIAMLVSATVATLLGGAALHTARGLRRRLDEMAAEPVQEPTVPYAAPGTPSVPAARQADGGEIQAAVTQALAEERKRELEQARAFWAAQEARDAEPEYDLLLEGHGTEYAAVQPEPRPAEETPTELDSSLLEALLEGRQSGLEGLYGTWESALFVPRQTGTESEPPAGHHGSTDPPPDGGTRGHDDGPGDERDHLLGNGTGKAGPADIPPARDAEESAGRQETHAAPGAPDADPVESAERAAARRRHPSHPDFTLNGESVGGPVSESSATPDGPVLADQERTLERLARLAYEGTPLVDIRSGPLGTLDVYSFADGNTLCLAPGHRETAERLGAAIDAGLAPKLLGGSGAAGAYTLTFTIGDERVYTLADRVIASL